MKSNMVRRSTGGKKAASSASESSMYWELLEKESERDRPGVCMGGMEASALGMAERSGSDLMRSAMMGRSSGTTTRLEGLRRWRGLLG